MKEKTYGIVLGILNTVLLVICGVFFWGKDKNAPEILLPSADIVYAAEADEDVLFQGVTAFDEEDGELTDLVVIEKIVTDEEKETATITYGVVDKAGNVGKATYTVSMYVEEDLPSGNPEGNTESHGESEVEDGVSADSDRTGAEPEEDGTLEEEDGSEDGEPGDGSEEDTDREPEEDEATEDGVEEESEGEDEEPEEESEGEALPTAGEAGNVGQSAGSGQSSGKPTIVFRSQEVKAKIGASPAWVNVIEGLHDDKDNYETLLKTLKVNGDYDKDKAGTYNVTVTVTDGEGNESNAYPMKIVVEAWE